MWKVEWKEAEHATGSRQPSTAWFAPPAFACATFVSEGARLVNAGTPSAGRILMFSKKVVIATLAAAGVFGAAALTLDVDIRVKDSPVATATPPTAEWSPTTGVPKSELEVYYPGSEGLRCARSSRWFSWRS